MESELNSQYYHHPSRESNVREFNNNSRSQSVIDDGAEELKTNLNIPRP